MASEHVHESASQVRHRLKARPDDTPPRNRVIFGYTVLVVLALIGLKFVFDSYLDASRQRARLERIAESRTSRVLAEYRESERERLERSTTSIERAMRELSRRDRMAFPAIRPVPSTDRAPLIGWEQLPREPVEEPAVQSSTKPLSQAGPSAESGPLPEGLRHQEGGTVP